jgi:fatty acid desaturase
VSDRLSDSARPRDVERRRLNVAQAAASIHRETALGPKWNTTQAIAGVALTLLFFISVQAMVRVTFSGRRAWRRGRFNLAVRDRPYVGLLGGYLALYAASYGWNTSARWVDAAFFALGAWLAMRVVAVAARSTSESASRIILPSSVQRWLTARLKNRRDLHYANLLVVNSLVIVPALVGVLVPPFRSVFTVVIYLLVVLFMGLLQESLIHSDVHNHFFRCKHLKDAKSRAVFKSINVYLKCVIPFISGRFPLHYTVEHGMIHHVENNSVDDVQSTVWYDRKSFVDYSRFALRQALQVSTAYEWYRYLAKRRMKKAVVILAKGQILRYGAIAIVGLYNLPAAILLIVHPLLVAVPRANSIILWHGLVDVSDPANPYTNSINIAAGPAGIHAWHVEHHVQPGDHWSEMRDNAERDRAKYALEGTITFVPHPQLRELFLRAMWTRRFDLLATMCVPNCPAQRNRAILARTLAERSEPLIATAHSRRYLQFERWLSGMVSRYLLRSRFPVESRGAARDLFPGSNTNYVEG